MPSKSIVLTKIKPLLLSRKWEIGAWVVFITFTLFLLLKHEPWLDESQAFLIARDAKNWPELFKIMGYEGTPALWHIILRGLIKIFHFSFSDIRHFHWLLSAAVAAIWLLFSPLPRWQRIPLIFGYYFLYEYSIIARSYVLTVLLLFVLAMIYQSRFKRPLLYFAALTFLSQTNIHGFIIFFILTLFYLWETRRQIYLKSITKIILVLTTLISIFTIWQVNPPPDLAKGLSWLRHPDLSHMFFATTDAFSPIPNLQPQFWDGHFLNILLTPTPYCPYYWLYYAGVYIIFGIVLFCLPLFVLNKRPLIVVYLTTWWCFNLIFLILHPGGFRHHGLIWVFFVFLWWISYYYPEEKTEILPLNKKLKNLLIALLIIMQLAGASIATYYETKNVFAYGQPVVQYLKDNNYLTDKNLIITFHANVGATIAPFLPNNFPTTYDLEYQRPQTYVIWNKNYGLSQDWKVNDLIAAIDQAKKERPSDQTILLSFRQIIDSKFFHRFKLVKSFTNAIQIDSNCYIYLDTQP